MTIVNISVSALKGKNSPQGASCKSSKNKSTFVAFAALQHLSTVHKSLGLSRELPARLTYGLSKLGKLLIRVVFPEPGSPASRTDWFASNMMFKRCVYAPY